MRHRHRRNLFGLARSCDGGGAGTPHANVLEGTDGKSIFADGDTLSINRGTTHGVALGARYAFYRDRLDGMPLFHLGDAVVVELGELTSKAIVVRTNDAITLADVAIPRRRLP